MPREVEEAQAARLRAIEERLLEIGRDDRGGRIPDADLAGRLDEVSGMFEESKRLARDGHTAIFARIAIQASFLIGRLELAVAKARREGRVRA